MLKGKFSVSWQQAQGVDGPAAYVTDDPLFILSNEAHFHQNPIIQCLRNAVRMRV